MKQLGLALILTFLAAGCAHERYYYDGKTPEVVFTSDRKLFFHNRQTTLRNLADSLEKSDYPKTRTLPIRVENIHDLRAANDILIYLRIRGYTRAILTTEREATSELVNDKERNAL